MATVEDMAPQISNILFNIHHRVLSKAKRGNACICKDGRHQCKIIA